MWDGGWLLVGSTHGLSFLMIHQFESTNMNKKTK